MSDLLKINVNDHTEKKGNLTYLSWAWAWAEVLKVDPNAQWEAVEYPNPDGTLGPCMWVGETAMVKTKVTILGKTKSCQLAVMDNRNNAVKKPDARKISDAIMRCMTKAISMHGLGLYLYAGEDLPEGEEAERQDRRDPSPRASAAPRRWVSWKPFLPISRSTSAIWRWRSSQPSTRTTSAPELTWCAASRRKHWTTRRRWGCGACWTPRSELHSRKRSSRSRKKRLPEAP